MTLHRERCGDYRHSHGGPILAAVTVPTARATRIASAISDRAADTTAVDARPRGRPASAGLRVRRVCYERGSGPTFGCPPGIGTANLSRGGIRANGRGAWREAPKPRAPSTLAGRGARSRRRPTSARIALSGGMRDIRRGSTPWPRLSPSWSCPGTWIY